MLFKKYGGPCANNANLLGVGTQCQSSTVSGCLSLVSRHKARREESLFQGACHLEVLLQPVQAGQMMTEKPIQC